MAAFYADRITKGIITINEVPKLWRDKTEKLLTEKEVSNTK